MDEIAEQGLSSLGAMLGIKLGRKLQSGVRTEIKERENKANTRIYLQLSPV
jgi:hypothetical protein